MSATPAARTALVGLRCRTAERSGAAARGVQALSEVLGRRLEVAPRLIGSPARVQSRGYGDDLAASRGCLLEAGGQVEDALSAAARPALVAADAAVALTTLPTVSRLRPDARVLWLDAHGAFHTPQTTATGYLGGMALAGACGRWGTGFTGYLPADRLVLCGVRALDSAERAAIDAAGTTVIGTTLETLVYLQNALDGSPTYVHLDVDVLDPEVLPLSRAVPNGFDEDKLFDLLDTVADSCEVVGVEVTGFEAPDDPREAPALAELVAGLLDPLLP